MPKSSYLLPKRKRINHFWKDVSFLRQKICCPTKMKNWRDAGLNHSKKIIGYKSPFYYYLNLIIPDHWRVKFFVEVIKNILEYLKWFAAHISINWMAILITFYHVISNQQPTSFFDSELHSFSLKLKQLIQNISWKFLNTSNHSFFLDNSLTVTFLTFITVEIKAFILFATFFLRKAIDILFKTEGFQYFPYENRNGVIN